jgi:hypothetical protein
MMTDREKRLVIRTLSMARGLLENFGCPNRYRDALLRYQCDLAAGWEMSEVDTQNDEPERTELIAEVNQAILRIDPNARQRGGPSWRRRLMDSERKK